METLLVLNVILLYILLGVACLIYSDISRSTTSSVFLGVYLCLTIFLVITINSDVFLIYEVINNIFLIGL